VQAWNDLVHAFAVAGDLQRLQNAMKMRYDSGFRVHPTLEMRFFRSCLFGQFDQVFIVFFFGGGERR
jgi:hypothetical protein